MNKQKALRNKNPLPDSGCINVWLIVPVGWCHGMKKSSPEAKPNPGSTSASDDQPGSNDASSAKTQAEKCTEAMQVALEAAHDVDVGDQNFAKKNYRGALLRYEDAAELKPQDSAIHVRMGRACEQLNQRADAIEHYKEAIQLGGPEKWIAEAKAALQRLEQAAEKTASPIPRKPQGLKPRLIFWNLSARLCRGGWCEQPCGNQPSGQKPRPCKDLA